MGTQDDQTLRSLLRDEAYHVERVLNEGPSGTTELVTLDGEGPLVRKRIPAKLANAAAWATVMGLNDPLLPQVEDIYRMPDELVVVCTYVQGDSLRELMEREGRLQLSRATAILRCLCHAAGVLHEHGVVHRDITPGNVIVAQDGAHLIDLGIARREASDRDRDTYVLGTWGFAAPEQFGFAQTDARSDVFSLGCLLGFMLTGVSPQADVYERALAEAGLEGSPVASVIERATAFEPSARYQSTAELADALARAEAGEREAPMPAGADRFAAADGSAGPRKLSDAGVLPLIAGALAWVACGAWAFLIAATSISALRGDVKAWGPPQFAMAIITLVGTGQIMLEVYRALTHRGHYAQKPARFPIILLRILIIIGLTFILMMAVGILLALWLET